MGTPIKSRRARVKRTREEERRSTQSKMRQARRLIAALKVLIAHDAGHLTPQCMGCGLVINTLEINHLWADKGYVARVMGAYRLALAYWREYWAGAERGWPEHDLRCPDCNRRYRPLPRPASRAEYDAVIASAPLQPSFANAAADENPF